MSNQSITAQEVFDRLFAIVSVKCGEIDASKIKYEEYALKNGGSVLINGRVELRLYEKVGAVQCHYYRTHSELVKSKYKYPSKDFEHCEYIKLRTPEAVDVLSDMLQKMFGKLKTKQRNQIFKRFGIYF